MSTGFAWLLERTYIRKMYSSRDVYLFPSPPPFFLYVSIILNYLSNRLIERERDANRIKHDRREEERKDQSKEEIRKKKKKTLNNRDDVEY